MGELDLIRWIRAQLGRRRGRIIVDSGDDAAVVRFGKSRVLFKTDCVLDGIHFDSRTAKPEEIGHKAIARCLSDIAAMGCRPAFAVVALMAPSHARERYLQRVIKGMEKTARAFGTAIVGGDVASHKGKLGIAVALLGEEDSRPPVRRTGARPGDAVAVTGPLGGSILGKHLRFTPRVKEGIQLNRRFDLHAMIDLSDGLATDLRHLCEESGVGVILNESRIPVAPAARKLSRRDGKPPLQHALTDGEDYELLFAFPSSQARRLERARRGRVIGEVTAMSGVYLRRRDASLVELTSRGWEHDIF